MLKWLTNVLRGDFGRSQTRNEPVSGLIVSRLGNTLVLSGSALVLAITLGLVAGSVAAVRPRSWLDRLSTMGSLVGTSLPSFWVGIVLIVIFSQTLRIFPTSGMYSPRGAGPLDVLWHLVLPAFTLAAASAGVIARITRAALLDVLAQEYVTVARAKGLRRRQVVVVHALRNALIPIVTVIGLQAGFLLGGAVITETVFAWPGLGSQMIDAISRRDVPLALGSVLVVSAGFVLANLIADVSHGVIDPRLRS
jgi:peptide/nickel transport system permease protein